MASSARKITGILLAISAVCCSRPQSGEDAYRQAWSAYVSGDLARALAAASENAARWRRDPSSPWRWKFRLLEAEVLTAQSKANEAESLLKDAVPAHPELIQLEARRLIDLAQLRPKDASGILQRARAVVTDPELEIRLDLVEGIIAKSRGRNEDAEKAFRAGLEVAVRQNSLYWQAQTLSNLSVCSKARDGYEESIDLGLRALTLADKAGARRVAAFAHGNLGSSYSYLGEFESALEHQAKAVTILEEIGARSNLMIALGELGLIYDRQGESGKAIPHYQRAYEIARELKNSGDAQRTANNLALALIKSERWDEAEQWNQRAFELAASSDDRDSIPYLLRNRARIAAGRGRPEEAARIGEDLLRMKTGQPSVRWEAYALLGQIDSEARRFAKANQEFENALRTIDGTRSEMLNSQFRITFLSRLIDFYRAYVSSLVEQNDDAGALRVAESSRGRVLAERLGRNLPANPFPGQAGAQRIARSIRSSLLSFWLAPAQSYAWLITAGGTRRFSLPPSGEIEEMVAAYRQTIEHSVRDPLVSIHPLGAKLWNTVFAGIAPHIPKDSRLIVIPDGALHRLNLETLVVPAPQAHYWIEDVEIAVAPSITIAASKRVAPARRPASLLLIGAPEYKGSPYEPLEKAESEVRGIQSRFGGVTQAVYTGPRATPTVYRQAEPYRFSVIHFAAHAEANHEKPLESAVILSREGNQYKLYAREVIDIPIRADLVTISGCRSAGMRAYAGEGLIGFAWAFLQAGARSVVAGLWDVSDHSTELLMNEFYAGIASGRAPPAAMRHAKLALLKGDPRYRRPYYWAPFQMYVGQADRPPR